MAEHSQQDDLMKSLLAKLYNVLTGGDESAPKAKDRFVAWCAPGIPIAAEDLTFLGKGLVSDNPDKAKAAVETKRLLAQASDFARLVNLAPDPSGVYGAEQQKTTYEQSGNTLWTAYGNALDYSEVAAGDLSQEQQAKIKKFRDLLTVTTKVKNIVTDAIEEKKEDGPILKAYNEKRWDADAAVLDYNAKRLDAMNATDAHAVQDWALNGATYRRRMKAALDAWVSQGYKNEIDQINAYIDQVTRSDLRLWKAALIERFGDAKETDLNNMAFYRTSLVPPSFAESDHGWTEFRFAEAEMAAHEHSETNSWSVSGGGAWGLFGGRVNVSGSNTATEASLDTSNFAMKFKITQVPISRPWFSPEFLMNKAWRFQAGKGMSPLSDGGTPPSGQLVAYPTALIFARDIVIDFAELHNKESTFTKSLQSGAQASFGLWSMGGSYSRSVGERNVSSKIGSQGLEVAGMQIIGFKCAILPAAPSPDPTIKKWA